MKTRVKGTKISSKATAPNSSLLGIQHILVTTDFSDASKLAFAPAHSLVEKFRASITFLHVVERYPIDAILGREQTQEATGPLIEQARVRLTKIAADWRERTGIESNVVVRFGKPFDEITRGAKELEASLIVIATHGYTGLKHAYLGSVAERVVRHAHCPVLVVRDTKQ